MSLHRPKLVAAIPPGMTRVVMSVSVSALAVAVLAHASILDLKPFMQWTWNEAAGIIDASPWVSMLEPSSGMSHGYLGQVASFLDPRTIPGLQKYRNEGAPYLKNRYRVRLLTAKPVREAYLRFMSLVPEQIRLVSLTQLKRECSPDSEQLRLDGFMRSNPDDVRVKGSDDYIVLAVTATSRSYLYHQNINIIAVAEFLNREAHPDPFGDLQLPALQQVTLLSTKSGKKVGLARYEKPGPDNLGAKFYFPRFLPDGSPLIAGVDKELRFETRIDDYTFIARWDTKRLRFQGKLEY